MTVYVHDIPPSRRGLGKRLQDHSSWDGPALVVCVERNRNVPNRVWVRLRTKVKSFPLEKIRLATPDEMLGSHYIVQILDDMAEDIKQGKLLVEEAPAGRGQVHAREEIFDPEDMENLDDEQAAKRIKQVRRQGMLDDVPEALRQTTSSGSSTSCVLGRKLDNQERMDLLREDEEMMQGKATPGGGVPQASQSHGSSVSSSAESKWLEVSPVKEPSKMKFQEKRQLFETFAKKQGRPSVLTEAQLRSGMEQASSSVRSIKKIIRKGKVASQRLVKKGRMEAEEAQSMVLFVDEEMSDTEKQWHEACELQELQEVFWAQQEGVAEEAKVMADEVQKKHKQDAEEAKVVTGKARLEYDWNRLSQVWKDAYREPLLKAIRIYFDHQALEGVPVDQVLDARRILTTRFVLTNKGEEVLEKAVLKARLILGGHRDPDMGKFPTLAPTASMLAHNLINWISVQKGWVVKYEDVSSAFLQGKPLPPEREVYIKLPRGYPDYLLDFIHSKLGGNYKKDVLKLTKGFGLPESPRLWYLCYKETLCECGMKEMTLLPGVFAAYHPSGELRALACIHVDDTRYCGDESSEEIWKKVHDRLNFGDLRKATDGWVKFCGRWERQNADTLEFEYAMNDYAKALQKLELPVYDKTKEAADDEVPKLTAEQRLHMSSVIGQLNWMARQGRYDLSYGVSNVQQLMARGGVDALEWLNKVIYRAKQETFQVVPRIDDWQNCVVVSASDAAFGAQPGGYSQGGMLVGLAEPAILEGEAKIAIMEAASMKIQRVVRCSMSAEVSMAATAFEHGDFVRAALSEMLHNRFSLKEWKLWASKWRHFLVIDAKTGFDVLNNESQTSDRKIQIDLAVLKQALMEGETNAFARWVPGHHMIADGVTKWYGNGALQRALKEGVYSLKDTTEARDLRHEAAQKRKQYKKIRKAEGP